MMARFCATIVLFVSALGLCTGAASRHRPARDIGQTIVLSPLNTTSGGGMHHAYWFRRLFGTELSARAEACAKNGTVPPPGSTRPGCHWLFEQGPCAARQWLVMGEGANGLAPVCSQRPCAPGFELLADERRCVRADELCSGVARRAFRYSLRGDGRCHCKGFYLQAPDGSCQRLYDQGTCPAGQMLAPLFDSSLESVRGACVRNPCSEGAVRVEGAGGQLSACVAVGDLDCSLTITPLLSADAGLYVPLCIDSKRHVIRLHSHPPRNECPLKDFKGVCVPTVVRTPQPFDWSVDEGAENVTFPSATTGGTDGDRR